ncbi:hypothetical protein [Shewanella mangrovisoli]|uniref:hypothetical protein n=1 Tax=Shewanella mangrovisoli TaxID=2864211 RepID=UPI001C65EAF1|nr:hypothetical protein [Shewanella mangrovisoli]QYK08556.1 hypothetical protein K0H60_17375 [Shewanella mangrovisoli]
MKKSIESLIVGLVVACSILGSFLVKAQELDTSKEIGECILLAAALGMEIDNQTESDSYGVMVGELVYLHYYFETGRALTQSYSDNLYYEETIQGAIKVGADISIRSSEDLLLKMFYQDIKPAIDSTCGDLAVKAHKQFLPINRS